MEKIDMAIAIGYRNGISKVLLNGEEPNGTYLYEIMKNFHRRDSVDIIDHIVGEILCEFKCYFFEEFKYMTDDEVALRIYNVIFETFDKESAAKEHNLCFEYRSFLHRNREKLLNYFSGSSRMVRKGLSPFNKSITESTKCF